MSLGNEWKKKLDARKIKILKPSEAEKLAAEEQRAEETILKLQQSLNEVQDHRCLAMTLGYHDVVGQRFEGLYGKKFVSSDRFLWAAKIVVEYCLENGLDVYVWEEDFSMTLREKIGAEIWVTPHGVPY